MISNYIICATARSGSNLLCELLASLEIAGRPFEHLWEPAGSEPEPLGERWSHILEDGRGENGVFGTKLLWYQAERLERELPQVLGRPGMSLAQVLAATLADPKYIYLTRRDRIRQAVSFVRAMQTEQWRSTDTAASEPQYDADAIIGAIRFFDAEEASWEDFFLRQAISPYRLTYEELESSPRDAIGRLLRDLGYEDALPSSLPESRHQRQADEVTEAWVGRYQREGQV
jgi:LPS sulfotransferase NodH